jgi:chromate reductase
LSELGCLPVSAMVHIASAAAVLDHHGAVPADAAERWDGYVDRCLSQLEWWARAACEYRRQVDPNVASPAFRRAPTQRDAPYE